MKRKQHMDGDDEFDAEEKKDPVQEVKKLKETLIPKCEAMAKKYLLDFFTDKDGKMKHANIGGEILMESLLSPFFIRLVLDMGCLDGIDEAYDLIKRNPAYANEQDEIDEEMEPIEDEESETDALVTPSIKLVLDAISECKVKKIPKQFRSGITLANLELVHGIILPRPRPK